MNSLHALGLEEDKSKKIISRERVQAFCSIILRASGTKQKASRFPERGTLVSQLSLRHGTAADAVVPAPLR